MQGRGLGGKRRALCQTRPAAACCPPHRGIPRCGNSSAARGSSLPPPRSHRAPPLTLAQRRQPPCFQQLVHGQLVVDAAVHGVVGMLLGWVGQHVWEGGGGRQGWSREGVEAWRDGAGRGWSREGGVGVCQLAVPGGLLESCRQHTTLCGPPAFQPAVLHIMSSPKRQAACAPATCPRTSPGTQHAPRRRGVPRRKEPRVESSGAAPGEAVSTHSGRWSAARGMECGGSAPPACTVPGLHLAVGFPALLSHNLPRPLFAHSLPGM